MVAREELSCTVSTEVAQSLREIAEARRVPVDDVVEQVLAAFVENGPRHAPDEEVMAHYRASVERNRHLGELLAQ